MNKNSVKIQDTKKTNDSLTPIAIVGMASILPDAKNLSQYWDNILNEVNSIKEVPPSRWSVAEYYDPDPTKPDKSYSKYGGFIPDIEFDPIEFGLPPNLLEVTDVSQLLSLIVTRDALTDAGYIDADESLLDRTGVILGMVGMSSNIIQPLLSRLQYPIWEKALKSSGIKDDDIQKIVEKIKSAYISWNENAFPGAIGNVIAGRIANRFNLGGTNCVIDAACASSLSAVKMAVSELIEGHADMMITGGVDTDNSILTYMCFSKTPAFSKGDRLKAFDGQSDGMLAGEGIGMLILKRLEDAEADHDRIYAVIKGVGSSSDGRSKSIYAPRSGGQAKAIHRAYKQAQIPLNSVGLIEAHGTGTNAGDAAEFEGLREVFAENGSTGQFIALGSIKSQIGHTKATAGAAGLIKTSLALYHKVLPATINVTEPNPEFNIKNSPFFINSETRPWFKKNNAPFRRAGVSSFGFGGTNFHIVLEEYLNGQEIKRVHSTPKTILLSAASNDLLMKECQETIGILESAEGPFYLNQLDQSAENLSIPDENVRVGFIAETIEQAIEEMQLCTKLIAANDQQNSWSHPQGIFYRSSGMDPEGKTVALFPGQGAQYVNMGKELVINFPELRLTFEKADEIISTGERAPLTDVVFPIPVFSDEEKESQKESITKTENAQPAIGTLSMGLYKMLAKIGFKADYFSGHSFGELTALWASGALDDEAFLRLAKARGEAMVLPADSGDDTGAMAAVRGAVDLVQEIVDKNEGVIIANINSPTQVVIAGSTPGVSAVKLELEQKGLNVIPLQVSAAFHTTFVKHAQIPFKHAIEMETFHAPIGKVYSNSTAQVYQNDPKKISKSLEDHILNPVLFKKEIECIYEDGGQIFIEIGPKNILTNLVNEILKDRPHETISLNANPKGDSDLQYRQAVLQMRVLGFKLGTTDIYKKHCTPSVSSASKVSVLLNGGLYTTEKTKKAFEESLQQEPFINSGEIVEPKNNEPSSSTSPNSSGSLVKKGSSPTSSNLHPFDPEIKTENQFEIEKLVNRLQDHQSDFMQVHQQFLKNDAISKNILGEISKSEISIFSGPKNNLENQSDQILSVLEKRAEFVHAQHSATASAHLEYIKSQNEFSQQYSALITVMTNSNMNEYSEIVFQQESISEDEVLMKSTDSQSNGINSISNEIQIDEKVETTGSSSIDNSQLRIDFLQIVSDKTGYPTDMLESEMDMEADLGIDSIKRVEILGAIQEIYPQLPVIPAADLAVLRTLEHIINAFNTTEIFAEQEIFTESPFEKDNEIPSSIFNEKEIESAFLTIVSEKTGYPVDMLDLEMDTEADLGIDSIKRVEILGAIQQRYPDLPLIAAEELAVLRTLKQIVGALNANPEATPQVEIEKESIILIQKPVEERTISSNIISESDLRPAFLEIVSEKTGYPADMLELGMDLEADLGIDSIKRVEILGAMQERFPSLPVIQAEDLAILHTIEQIITTFTKQDSDIEIANGKVLHIPNPESSSKKSNRIERFPVEAKQIAQPDYLEFDLPKENLILITDDGSAESRLLAESFITNGITVGLVHLGSNGEKQTNESGNGILHFNFDDFDDEKIKFKMEKIIAAHEKIGAFIHLHASDNTNQEDLLDISDESSAVLRSVFLIARHLKKPLIAASSDSRSAFLTITRVDGQFGLNGNKSHDPIPGGFSGLAKTLRLEWNSVFCRALDIHPDIDSKTVVKIINNELHDPNLILAEVGYTKKGRYTLSLGKNEKVETA